MDNLQSLRSLASFFLFTVRSALTSTVIQFPFPFRPEEQEESERGEEEEPQSDCKINRRQFHFGATFRVLLLCRREDSKSVHQVINSITFDCRAP